MAPKKDSKGQPKSGGTRSPSARPSEEERGPPAEVSWPAFSDADIATEKL